MRSDTTREIDGAHRPGVRTFKSPRFRLVLATTLVGLGVLMNALFLSALDAHPIPMGVDFHVYREAAARMTAGQPLYSEAQLEGPIAAVCEGCFLYPPVVAQALRPATWVPFESAKIIWCGTQFVVMVLAVWIATGISGARRSWERLAWCTVAALWFVPLFATLWLGNVTAVRSLSVTLVALGGAAAGWGVVLGAFLEVTPVALLPATLAMGPASRRSLLVGVIVVGLVSVALAPSDWLDYPTVLMNMLRGSGEFDLNNAPTNVAFQLGVAPVGVTIIRLATLVIGVVCVVVSVLLARGRTPMAALLGTVAMLLVPGTMWYHYLAVLLPFAAMAWVRAGVWVRTGLLFASAIIAIGAGSPSLALVGAITLVLLSGFELWRFWPDPDPAEPAGSAVTSSRRNPPPVWTTPSAATAPPHSRPPRP